MLELNGLYLESEIALFLLQQSPGAPGSPCLPNYSEQTLNTSVSGSRSCTSALAQLWAHAFAHAFFFFFVFLMSISLPVAVSSISLQLVFCHLKLM